MINTLAISPIQITAPYKHSTQAPLQLVLLTNGMELIYFIKLISSK